MHKHLLPNKYSTPKKPPTMKCNCCNDAPSCEKGYKCMQYDIYQVLGGVNPVHDWGDNLDKYCHTW